MKQTIRIVQGTNTVYHGRISDIPIKEEFIIKKSIELFDDEDPCIIHQSYIIKEYVDVILGLFKQENANELHFKNHADTLSFLNLKHSEDCVLFLEV